MAGCVAFPEKYEDEVGVPDIVNQYSDLWSKEPAIRYVPSTSGVSIRKYFQLPEHISAQPVSLKLDDNVPVTVNDLISALRAQGYRVIARLGEEGRQPLLVRRFDGSMGAFVEELSHTQNIAFEYRHGTIFFQESNRYSVSLPQHEGLLTQVATALTGMGATDVRADLLAGTVDFSVKPDILGYARDYLDLIAQNSAMIRLQVAVVTVGLTRDLSVGLDWSSIMAQAGKKSMLASDTGSESNPLSQAAAAMGQAFGFSGTGGMNYLFNGNNFSLSAVVKALSTYGDARTEQNVVLGTVSGMPVRISSGNDIPYVKSIGSTISSGGGTAGTTQTEIIESGLKLEVTPNFNSQDNSFVTNVKVNMSSLVGFRELSAGINLGTLSQPEMQNLEFENVSRLRAGETIVVGGITYDQMSNSYNNLPGLERAPVGSKTGKVNKNAIYIVIRPTAVVFSKDANVVAQDVAKEVVQTPSPPVTVKAPASAPVHHVEN